VALTGTRTFTGFGFGAIQAGLFLHEAFFSGRFGRLVVAELQPDLIRAVRQAGGHYWVNVAHHDRIEAVPIGPVEVLDPGEESDCLRLIAAVAASDEMATAVPSVQHFLSPSPGSLHRIIAQGLRTKGTKGGPRAVLYAAENHNHAAEILEETVRAEIPAAEQPKVSPQIRFLNTVIGKMSGIVAGAADLRRQGLVPIAPGLDRAFLVEAFNRILISRVRFDECAEPPFFTRGIEVFQEKDDLLPFEEAKLYGHNATHALAAYVAAVRGVRVLADLRGYPEITNFIRSAFLEESGGALVRKHNGVDFLFTPEGFREHADDLLARMMNPFLHDTVERVGRDPERKLAWDDRLVGTIRLALRLGIKPARYAFGAAAALAALGPSALDEGWRASFRLDRIWSPANPDVAESAAVLDLIEEGRQRLRRWIDSDFRSDILDSDLATNPTKLDLWN
jgi:mannitol-1-phosphate 5-dehydrogenase